MKTYYRERVQSGQISGVNKEGHLKFFELEMNSLTCLGTNE